MNSDIVIDAKDVTVCFGDKVVLENINLEVEKYETIVFIGPSGSGKTVLLKTLAGLYPPVKGRVLIEGEDWQNLESDHKHDLARKLGMVFQQGALFDTLTALENVEFPLKEHLGLPQDEVDAIASDLLAKVNLADSWYKKPSELSGGMQRRLGIARAMALNPEVTFYDDPTAGQDPIQCDMVLNLIAELKKRTQSTLIMTTSNVKVAYKMADRIFMVIDHKIIGGCSPDDFKNYQDPRVQQFIKGELKGPISVKS